MEEFNKNGRELQELLGSSGNHTTWSKDQISKLSFERTLDFEIVSETVRGGTKHTYFFTESAARRIAGHSEVRAEETSIVKDNMAAKSLTLDNIFANPEAGIAILQGIAEQNRIIAEQKLQLEEAIKTKSRIADRQTATALANSAVKSREINKLNGQLVYTKEVLESKDGFLTTVIAKDFGFSSAKVLNSILNDLKVQYKSDGVWVLYAKHSNKGYTDTKTHKFEGTKGDSRTRIYTVWTQKGREFIYSLLKENNLL